MFQREPCFKNAKNLHHKKAPVISDRGSHVELSNLSTFHFTKSFWLLVAIVSRLVWTGKRNVEVLGLILGELG